MYSLNLDTTSRQELYARACGRMAQLIPGWSDAIPSDPAVALLELASYLSTVQNREINTLRERHYLAYLKLLGESPRPLTPARLLAVPVGGGLPWPGLRFEIDGVPFEVMDAPENGARQVQEALLIQGDHRTALRKDGPLVVAPGTPAGLGLSLDAPLPPDASARLWLELQPEPGRTPPDGETPPPVLLSAQAWDGGGWQDVPCVDGTCGLLQSGYVALTPPVASSRLRMLINGAPEGEPRISAVALHPVLLEQRRTRSRCIQVEPQCRLPQDWVGTRRLRFFLPQGGGWLERFRLIGVPLEVRSPRYCPIEVRVHIRSYGPAAEHPLRTAAIQHTDGVTGPLDFGADVSYTALFAALGAVPGVGAVRGLELRALSGGGRRTQEGGIRLDADTLPYLERFQLTEK